MSNSYRNIHLLLHDIYLNKVTKIAPYAKQLDWFARSMLEKAKLTSNLERAKSLRALLDKHMAKNDKDDEHVEEIFLIHRLLSECFEVISDDLMLLSAFEMHAKGKLLRKGYLVHEVEKPNNLYKNKENLRFMCELFEPWKKKVKVLSFRKKRSELGSSLNMIIFASIP